MIGNFLNRWMAPPRVINRYRPDENNANDAVLRVLNVDLCLEENNKRHHTSHFFIAKQALIVRRGDPFRARIQVNRPIYDNDIITFLFIVADERDPNPRRGTFIPLEPKGRIDVLGDPNTWEIGFDTYKDTVLSVFIKPSVSCPVTEWKLEIDTKLQNAGSRSYAISAPIYILFNPWCKYDQVYMENRNERKEYVMHDTTLIWRGSYNRMRPVAWKLGQFERYILECSLKLVATVGRVSAVFRGDPVRVSRALSAAINAQDDNGVIIGNWTNNFAGGTPPTEWSGSTEILQQFYRTHRPVKFAQCWVFAGILTTTARCLGIPSRVVTCYASAHDANGSLTLDIFLDRDNRRIYGENKDSIWNFHVWNEVWMDRPDLGVGPHGAYAGWQVVDATPQEMSDNMYRTGPASVIAVKNGEILRPFDCGFVFAEVNADRIYWRHNAPHLPVKLLSTDTSAVGLAITTKAVLKWEGEDLTTKYKYKEKTDKEREIMFKALKQSHNAFSRYYLNEDFTEVDFAMVLRDDIKIGEAFSFVVKITNKSRHNLHTVLGHLICDAVLYTGGNAVEVKSINFQTKVQPNSSENVGMEVSFNDYYTKLLSQASFNIYCSAKVLGTDYEYYAQDDFRIRKPDIKLEFQGNIISHEPVDVILRLPNPLPMPLRKGAFFVEGPGIEKPLRFKLADIPVGGIGELAFKYVPPYPGRGALLAVFVSKELNDVDGYVHYEIQP